MARTKAEEVRTRVGKELKDALFEIAKANHRSLCAETLLAITAHVKAEREKAEKAIEAERTAA